MCDTSSILKLGLDKIEMNEIETFNFIMPFAYVIAIIITQSELINLYPDIVLSSGDKVKQIFFMTMTILGIVSTVAMYSKLHDYAVGLLVGGLLIIFAYVIPNLFLKKIMITYAPEKNHNKLLFGLAFLYLIKVIPN